MNKFKIFTAYLCAIIFLQAHVCYAFNLDKNFRQNFDQTTLSELKQEPGQEKALFFKDSETKENTVLYLRYEKNGVFVLRGNLPEQYDKQISRKLNNKKRGLYSPLKINGKPLYEYGSCYFFSKDQAECLYIPFKTGESENECFICDLGYFEARFSANTINPDQLCKDLLPWLTDKKLFFAGKVKLNRYYLFRDNYFGPVHYFYPDSIKEAKKTSEFMPVHKLTMNKHIKDWNKKRKQDLELFYKILIEERFLLSQDQRLKRGMVPAFVELNWNRIKETDIGSGQNQVVFLSIGPGINYFDDPWKHPRKNIPCPRLIFDNSIYGFKQLQIYPTFSIEPEAIGEGRLKVINRFQLIDDDSAKVNQRTPLWLPAKSRRPVIEEIEEALCNDNLLNDSPELRPGFKLMRKSYNGNIANNEIRIKDAISPTDTMRSVVIPPDSRDKYLNHYIRNFRNISPHWQYICATRFNDLFVEAPTADDKGFRTAWLKWHLGFSHPALKRLLKLAENKNKPELQVFIAEKIARIIEDEGLSFFNTPYARHRTEIETKRLELWCEYLQAFRNNKAKAKQLLIKFINFYNYQETRLKP